MKWIHSCYALMRNVLEAQPVFCSLKQIQLKDAFLAALLLDHLKDKHLNHLLKYYEFEHPEKGNLLIVYISEWVIFRTHENYGNEIYRYYELQRTCDCITEYTLAKDFSTEGGGALVHVGHYCDVNHERTIKQRKEAIKSRMEKPDFLSELKRSFQN